MQNQNNPVQNVEQNVEYTLVQRLPMSACTRLDFTALNDLTHTDFIDSQYSLQHLNQIVNALTYCDVHSTVSYASNKCLVQKLVNMNDPQYFNVHVLQSNFSVLTAKLNRIINSFLIFTNDTRSMICHNESIQNVFTKNDSDLIDLFDELVIIVENAFNELDITDVIDRD